ncbi:hypothetical protein COO59_15940 [Mixta theicola]|uniref:Uncharacterized protein n=1 Tax=Mixta theicola TaxID=1458355 RepID=A0A2K1Q6F1_9GAMM|nr:hypothetical protein [Mixta theicola]PNS10613.1 hypothetical protein COO59_15940 [Mixta theicola]GLR11009.1 hypothetical protein GCM10007905_37290 [Mixta theicola]
MKKTIYLPQFDKKAEAEIFGKKITVRYEGNESFPRNLKVKEQFYVVIDGEEKVMVLTRNAIGSWHFSLL